MIETTIIQGNHLTDKQVDLMSNQRIYEYGINTKDFKNELESLFFHLSQDAVVKAFGMLKPLALFHDDQRYDILGIGNIMAIEKGAGYGKLLMQVIKAYLLSKNMTGMGFCDPDICGFYDKCGYQIINNLASRFRYRYAARDGQKEQLDGVRGILCIEGDKRQIVASLLANQEPIYIEVPFW